MRIGVHAAVAIGALALSVTVPVPSLPRVAMPAFASLYLAMLLVAATRRVEVDTASIHVHGLVRRRREYRRKKVQVSFGEVIGGLGRSDLTVMTIRERSGKGVSFPLFFFSGDTVRSLRHALLEDDDSTPARRRT